MASIIEGMQVLGKATEKSTDALQSTAVAMEEVEKEAVEMAKSVSGAIRGLVKMTLVDKGLGNTILEVVVGIKVLVQAIAAFVGWMVTIGMTIGLFAVLGKVLSGIPRKID